MTLRTAPLSGVLVLLAITMLAGCMLGRKPETPLIHVHNVGIAQPFQVFWRSCDSPEPLQALPDSSLSVGMSIETELPVSCADLYAITDQQTVVGTQRHVQQGVSFKWYVKQ